jgi:hypothetical protein
VVNKDRLPDIKKPSNYELYTAIQGFRDDMLSDLSDVKTDLLEVKNQVKETNGKVRRLEKWKAVVEAIDLYKKAQKEERLKETGDRREPPSKVSPIVTKLLDIIVKIVVVLGILGNIALAALNKQ